MSAPSPGPHQPTLGLMASQASLSQDVAPGPPGEPPSDWGGPGSSSAHLWAPIPHERPSIWAAGSAPQSSSPPSSYPPGLSWPQHHTGPPQAGAVGWQSTWQPPTLATLQAPITSENEILTFAITEGHGSPAAEDNAAAITARLAGHGIYYIKQFAGLRPVDLETILGEHTNAPELSLGLSAWARILHVASQTYLPSNLHYSPTTSLAPRTPPPRGTHLPDTTPGASSSMDLGAVLQTLARSHNELLRHQSSTLALQEKSLRASHRRDKRYLDPDLPAEDRGAVSSGDEEEPLDITLRHRELGLGDFARPEFVDAKRLGRIDRRARRRADGHDGQPPRPFLPSLNLLKDWAPQASDHDPDFGTSASKKAPKGWSSSHQFLQHLHCFLHSLMLTRILDLRAVYWLGLEFNTLLTARGLDLTERVINGLLLNLKRAVTLAGTQGAVDDGGLGTLPPCTTPAEARAFCGAFLCSRARIRGLTRDFQREKRPRTPPRRPTPPADRASKATRQETGKAGGGKGAAKAAAAAAKAAAAAAQAAPAQHPSAPQGRPRRPQVCLQHDPANNATCPHATDGTCLDQRGVARVHLDTRIDEQAHRFKSAKTASTNPYSARKKTE